MNLPLATAVVDIVISSLVLHHLAEAAAVRHLAEMDRVGAPRLRDERPRAEPDGLRPRVAADAAVRDDPHVAP